MDKATKWKAVLACDKSYDGKFYYAVKTTGVFCRPSCKSKAPSEKNVCFFMSIEKAKKAGFRPCKRCRPDIEMFEPDIDIVITAKNIIDRLFLKEKELNKALMALGVTKGHLSILFKRHMGITPRKYCERLRILKAAELLAGENKLSIVYIADICGYESLSTFYNRFKQYYGFSPGKYRKMFKQKVI